MSSTLIEFWDSGQSAALWDSGLQWDVNVGGPLANIDRYLNLITAQHKDKPNYITFISIFFQGQADLQANLAALPAKFDVDTAAGIFLDQIGQWVGVARNVNITLTNVYFSLDDAGLGLDLGSMQGPADPSTGIVSLPDDAYRTLIRAKIAANFWDGTTPGAYSVWDRLFSGTGYSIKIHDKQNMHIDYELTGPVPDALTLALFTNGFLTLVPSGVLIDNYLHP